MQTGALTEARSKFKVITVLCYGGLLHGHPTLPRLGGATLKYSPFAQECMGQEDQEEIDKSIAEAYEAAEFIKTFVVQAKLNDRGNFGELFLVQLLIINAASRRFTECPEGP